MQPLFFLQVNGQSGVVDFKAPGAAKPKGRPGRTELIVGSAYFILELAPGILSLAVLVLEAVGSTTRCHLSQCGPTFGISKVPFGSYVGSRVSVDVNYLCPSVCSSAFRRGLACPSWQPSSLRRRAKHGITGSMSASTATTKWASSSAT